jgi:predicted RNase H-like nuclease (RuvC/YqgF family)
MELPGWLQHEAAQVIGAALAGIFGLTRIRAYLKTDKLDNARVDAEYDVIATLRGEIERMAAGMLSNSKAILDLQTENRELQRQNATLRNEISALKREMRLKDGR